jgi:hypothetical protein
MLGEYDLRRVFRLTYPRTDGNFWRLEIGVQQRKQAIDCAFGSADMRRAALCNSHHPDRFDQGRRPNQAGQGACVRIE